MCNSLAAIPIIVRLHALRAHPCPLFFAPPVRGTAKDSSDTTATTYRLGKRGTGAGMISASPHGRYHSDHARRTCNYRTDKWPKSCAKVRSGHPIISERYRCSCFRPESRWNLVRSKPGVSSRKRFVVNSCFLRSRSTIHWQIPSNCYFHNRQFRRRCNAAARRSVRNHRG